MNKLKVKYIVTVILVLIIIFWLTLLDWNNLLIKSNSGAFLGILVSILIIIAMNVKNKKDTNKNNS